MPDPSLVLLPASRSRDAIPIIPVTRAILAGGRTHPRQGRPDLAQGLRFCRRGRAACSPAGPIGKTGKGLLRHRRSRQSPRTRSTSPGWCGSCRRLTSASRAACPISGTPFWVGSWKATASSVTEARPRHCRVSSVLRELDRTGLLRSAAAHFLVRDLVNTPSLDMGPDELETAARRVAAQGRAKLRVVAGERLRREFPMIHTVGQASTRKPRLIDFTWGPARAPKVTLVGKGVCFDTGGLDIKPASGMLLMKKDMGGAANVLGLAQMIMAGEAQGPSARAHSGGRERDLRQCLSSGRCADKPQGYQGGDRQHRCRGPAHPGRCAGAGG